jgi:colanic acid biosynthesis glycosyl transferase WcaI
VRIAVHDYAGHPFQPQLSRELARRRHTVLHLYCSSVRTGKGALRKRADDPATFHVEGIDLGTEFRRYSPWRRVLQERAYAGRLVRRLRLFHPNVVISANSPLLSQRSLVKECSKSGVKFVFWQQDVLSVAIELAMKKRLPILGALAGRSFRAVERSLLLRSDAVVTISDDFRAVLERWGVAAEKTRVIENWAPLDEIPSHPRDNRWARKHGLAERKVFLYSGTLGLKHNPDLLLQLARHFCGDTDVRVVVVSEGLGAEWLEKRRREQGLENLVLLAFQPYEDLPDVLASGDVLVVVLESEAGVFSVPSKLLSYLCAGRPLLAAVPETNLAARIIQESGGGIVVEPGDARAFVAAADELLRRPELRSALGERARAYAVESFDIRRIADRFESLFDELVPV